ncbi:MAG TPA: T9SS type A sorting domain-containing protein [Chitinophagales bacterium]|nr:T9SS type A sorting domain-containing protein [Chitinophagales bacterium]
MKSLFRFSILLIALIALCEICKSQNSLVKQWDYRFGYNNTDRIRTVLQTKDGGYILNGESVSPAGGDKTQASWGGWDYWVVKLDSEGTMQWNKDFGGTEDDVLYSLQQTKDGGYILGGTTISGISGDKIQTLVGGTDYWIIKLDSTGNEQWQKDFGGTDNDALTSIGQTKDDGYILGGYSYSGIGGDKSQASWGGWDYWIIKVDSIGTIEWDKDFGGTAHDVLYSIEQAPDGGYIVGGKSASAIGGDKTQNAWGYDDYWIVKLDSTGAKQWDRDYGGTDNDFLTSLQQTTDGGYILGGLSASGMNGDKSQESWGSEDYWIVKLDSAGDKQWDRDFGGLSDEEDFGNVRQTFDGGFLVVGTSYSGIGGDKTENNLGVENAWIIKTDSLGIKQWDMTLFTNGHDEGAFGMQNDNGCYVFVSYTDAEIGGYKTQPSWGGSDYWIIKFCDTTIATAVNLTSLSHSNISISPNPFTTSTTITLTNYTTSFNLQLFDELGRETPLQYHSMQQGSHTILNIDRGEMLSGMYFLVVVSGEKREVAKVIVE